MLTTSLPIIDPSIFRSYDIRGVVGTALTEDNVFLIGKAIATLVLEGGENQLTVARDGRVSSPMLVKALMAGIRSTGCKVKNIGMVPTPLLYFATHIFAQHSGVMLTGSHNPSNYNGVKIVIKGKALSENGIQDLYKRIMENQFHEGEGSSEDLDVQQDYLDAVTSNIELARPLRVVIDAGNGATGLIAPRLFEALGCEVIPLFCEIDGRFPNHHPDPSQAENMQDLIGTVKEKKADIGLAFDGDGDRLGVVTSDGEIITADRLMMLFAKSVLAVNPKANIIFDVKCSNHLATTIRLHGGQPIMWKTGHSFIKAKLAEMNAHLAGEMSGHLFFKDRWYGFDDALYAGTRLLEILAATAENSQQLFASIPTSCITPELKIHVSEEEKFSLMQQLKNGVTFSDQHEINTIDGLRVAFADGWGLIRPSNTTPCLILRFEAINEIMLTHIQAMFKRWIVSVRPDLVLPF